MRLRFTICDLLWLTALVALGVAWWVDHGKWTGYYREAADRATRLAKERDDMEAETGKALENLRIRRFELETEYANRIKSAEHILTGQYHP
jgi:hypothetical protein